MTLSDAQEDGQPQSHDAGRVVTLEQFIVDTFTRVGVDGVERPVNQPDQIGGGGTYAIIGARIFVPPSHVGMIVDYTFETLSKDIRDSLCRYGDDMWCFRERNDGHPTARAVNRYHGQRRIFEYLTEPLLLTPLSLRNTPFGHLLPKVIHFISYPAPRADQVLSEVRALRQSIGWDPVIIWEVEDEEIDVVKRVIDQVDIIGPNHNEVIRLFSLSIPPDPSDSMLREICTDACSRLAALGPKKAAIVRCGHLGSCYAIPPRPAHDPRVIWVPAYWSPGREGWEEKVVDPTGAGNAFMGGVAAAVHKGEDVHQAVIWGSVAASFVIEQDGLPLLSSSEIGHGELWNGDVPTRRVQEMKKISSMML